jgi:orotidine-5'-phosphate decarboxylase
VTDARDRLALALDMSDIDEAERLAKEVSSYFGVAKVGLELFSAAGHDAIRRLRDQGFVVFADLKFHDIPTTVQRAARVIGRLGVGYLNFHAAGGAEMLRAGVEGLLDGARGAGHPRPVPIAVTVLTSDRDASAFDERLRAAIDGGCGGVVCSVQEIAAVKNAQPDFTTIVPGVRFAEGDTHDQSRVGTPAQVAAAGADILVIGRAVTAAVDPRAAAAEVHANVVSATRV